LCKPRNSLLTAGIAHEIKNPLNFVNNFAALSVELVDELDDVLKPAALDNKTREGTEELTQMLKGNLEKVVRSAAQGRLRRRAPTQPVTRPCRLPASGPIDNYPGESLPH